jgi:tetraacyldisaccharide 4'-kinase
MRSCGMEPDPIPMQMNKASDPFARRAMIGTGRAAGVLFRAISCAVEPFYAAATLARNKLFDAGIKRVTRLPRPVISIGNITAGGTGKTPMVRWMAAELRSRGKRVAILSRGYKAKPGTLGDELTMLDRALNVTGGSGGDAFPVRLRANPDRAAAGAALLAEHPDVDVFLLDDGFQHRHLARDLDVVLINAAEPFGFGHVLPRGLLREPLRGLRRAGVIVLTRCDRVSAKSLADTERRIRGYSSAPILHSVHAQTGFRSPRTPLQAPIEFPMTSLTGQKWFLFCGIADPGAVVPTGADGGRGMVGGISFGDHHDYSRADIDRILRDARSAGAEVLVTTEKDWVKLEPLWGSVAEPLPLWRVDVEVRFPGEGSSVLGAMVDDVVSKRSV